MRFPKELSFLLAVFPAILVALLASRGLFLFADTGFTAFHNVAAGEIFPLLHFSTNSFTSWRFDPLSHALFRDLGFGAYFAWLYVLLALGLTCAIHQIGRLSEFRSALSALAIVMLFLHLFAFDLLVISFSVALAWQCFVFSWIGGRSAASRRDYAFVILASLVCCSIANQLALLSTGIAAVITMSGRARAAVPVALAVALAFAMFFPAPEFPRYNLRGHVVPYYGVADGLQPLIGDGPPLSHIERRFVRSAYSIPGLQLVIVSAGLLLTLWPRWRGALGRAAPLWVAVVLALSLVADSDVNDVALSQISPLQSLSRVLPGTFFVSLAPLVLAATVILCSFYAAINVFSTALFVCGLVLTFRGETLSVGIADEILWRRVERLEDADRAQAERILRSPSYWLVREYGLDEVLAYARAGKPAYESAARLSFEVVASSNQSEAGAMRDENDHTAWTSKSGPQNGNEWLNFVFAAPQQLRAIRLESGDFFFNFPRAIELRVAESCNRADTAFDHYETVFPSRENQGELIFTPDGYPSFAWQYTFSALLPDERSVSCVLVRQTGTDPVYAWSVSEVSFAKNTK